ncbi:BON domain-containing protein [Melaminivora sp.]|uniref:BON domain-containing protein n=1 Tax=Melaminivora sp. TaxID=1933032 RepID=UPI0028B06011|nr:BON domain-containing protein [Melaminivora sp.]
MNSIPSRPAPAWRAAALATATVLAMGLAACNKNDDRTAGQKLDSAIDRTEQAAQDAKLRTEEAAREARADIKESAHDAKVRTEEASRDAGERMREAGENLKAETREVTANAKGAVEDAGITARVNAGLAKDAELSAIRIDVDTKDGVVTLSGPVKNEQARERATQIARGVDGVGRVVNNLNITPGS